MPMTAPEPNPRWFYKVGDAKRGPVSTEDLRTMFLNKNLPLESRVWREGMESWLVAKDVGDLLPADFLLAASFVPTAHAPKRHPAMIPALVAVAVALIGAGTVFLSGQTPARLLDEALHAPDPAAQLKATHGLLKLGPEALDEAKTVASQSTNLDVAALAIAGLANHRDYTSFDLLLEKLDDGSPVVRASAARGIARLLGRDYHYPCDGSPKERSKVKEKIVADWKELKDSELYRGNIERLQAHTETAP